MSKLFKILLAVGGVLASIFAIFSTTQSKNKKDFNKRTKANKAKLDFITTKATKVENQKKITKSNIGKTSNSIKTTKSKIKSTKNAKKVVDNFQKKYRK